jgi:hypothetical protein
MKSCPPCTWQRTLTPIISLPFVSGAINKMKIVLLCTETLFLEIASSIEEVHSSMTWSEQLL